jgi:hypothetical protein
VPDPPGELLTDGLPLAGAVGPSVCRKETMSPSTSAWTANPGGPGPSWISGEPKSTRAWT